MIYLEMDGHEYSAIRNFYAIFYAEDIDFPALYVETCRN